jgi:hypothetical protein
MDTNTQISSLTGQSVATPGARFDINTGRALAPSPTPAPTPANTGLQNFSTGDTSGRDQADIERATAGIGNANPTPQEMSQTTNMFQGEIDALNAAYASERANLVDQGKGRVNQVGAVQARQGLLGTGFASAQDNTQIDANNKILGSADAKHNLDIQAVYGKIDQQAQVAARNRYEAAKGGADALIQHIKETPANRQKAVDGAVQYLINQGIDPSKVTNEQLQGVADKINSGNSRYGVTPNDLATAYGPAKASADARQAIADAELAAKKATANKANYATVPNGSQLYDTATGKVVDSNAKTFAPNKYSVGGGHGTTTSKPIVSGKLNYTKADIADGVSRLNSIKGPDGFVDGFKYADMANAWQAHGGDVKDFVKNYPPKLYVDPADNKLLPLYLRNTTKLPKAASAPLF